ncbi:5-methylcytosine rRNA methyltransferase NSUN4 [Frankliniella fusca]|uniref:5-methylcytosine rRNA methyltransferase NSUN4 n=1 Tax=Frankliniella fusca TaxID=407009 RepID=A0AAE1HSZ1_9NEOP|nr:5-methylcytosine rRNA methyltransferase NSUN4 [Frankliniella fusca]
MESWTLVVLALAAVLLVGGAHSERSRLAYFPGDGRLKASVRGLPRHLVPCYSDPRLFARETRIPMTMANLVDLVQRVERDPGFVADLRVLTTTLLHRFRVDGLERDPLVLASPGVTPYRLSGLQHARHNVLAGRLLSGSADMFPDGALNAQQQCALHWMLSSAVDPWERGDERWLCPHVPTPRSNMPIPRMPSGARRNAAGGEVFRPRLYPDPQRDVGPWAGVNVSPPPAFPDAVSPAWSACPVEEGVVEAGRAGGGVAAGTVLAGVAAGLQPQSVPLASLLSAPHLARLRADGGRDSDTVDNLWAATLAGDLAEVAAYQGPHLAGPGGQGGLLLGPGGVWNDSLVPRVRYLSRERPGSPDLSPVLHWDMTDAEIRAGFDGLALGSRVGRWLQDAGRLRLSQVLDMYFSAKGAAFDEDVKACRRGATSAAVFSPDILFKQTSRFARTLTDSSPDAPYMTEAALANFTTASVRVFLRYAGDLLSADECDPAPLLSVRVNAVVILDTTWTRPDAFSFLASFTNAEGIDVGLFGSRIAVMNGGVGGPIGGHWIVNFTDSPVQLTTEWARVDVEDDIWPTYLDLPWSLMAIIEHMQAKAQAESVRGVAGGTHGDVVIILATKSTVSDTDMRHAKALRLKLKELNPDTRLLYVVTDLGEARFQELVNLIEDWDDAVIVVDDLSPPMVAHAVTKHLRDSEYDPAAHPHAAAPRTNCVTKAALARTHPAAPGRLAPAECVLVQGASGGPQQERSAGASPGTWPVQHGAHVWAAPGVRRGQGRARTLVPGGELEDYVSPGQLRLYRINTAYLRPGQPASVKIVGEDYGDLRLCVWRGAAPGGPAAAMKAALRAEEDGGLDGHGEADPQVLCINMEGSGEGNVTIAEPCDGGCAPLYVSVYGTRSYLKCSEDDCRYPDEMRYLLRPSGVMCVGAEPAAASSSAPSRMRTAPGVRLFLQALLLQALLALTKR